MLASSFIFLNVLREQASPDANLEDPPKRDWRRRDGDLDEGRALSV
jgi:hypothetical protein